MSRIAVVGELLIDLISTSTVKDLSEAASFRRFFAGSPGNLASNLSDLGIETILLSRVGNDPFGRAYLEYLRGKGIDTSFVQQDQEAHTSTVFISKSQSSPQFSAFRGADCLLEEPYDIDSYMKNIDFIHFTAWPLSCESSREVCCKLVDYALRKGIRVTFDPNYRQTLWPHNQNGSEFIIEFLKNVFLVKPSEDDANQVFGPGKPLDYIQKFHEAGAQNVILTLGHKGSMISDGNRVVTLPSCARRVVDTTGAGDAFWSGVLFGLLGGKDIFESAVYGNYCAGFRIEHEGKEVILPSIDALKAIFEAGDYL
ncbi:MAG: sugar kinase [Kosmotogaceae bacterium]|nr:sugar kinase [Kosmotogaceae bacterium]